MWNRFVAWLHRCELAFIAASMSETEILAAEVAELREQIRKIDAAR